jgi:hypothetical protein
MISAGEVQIREIVAGVYGTADGAFRLEGTGQVISIPRIETTEFEQFRSAIGTSLVAVGEVSLWDFCGWKLIPKDLVRLIGPPFDQVRV